MRLGVKTRRGANVAPLGAASFLLIGILSSAGIAGAEMSARATELPACTLFVDAAATEADGSGTVRSPYRRIADAIEAAGPAAVICVAEGVYAEELTPGDEDFTLAGGFQSGTDFKVRDSAVHVSRAQGDGGTFVWIEDPAPEGQQFTAIDGFDISGYSQAIVRRAYYSQRFILTNNHIHDNNCDDPADAGAGFSLESISGEISGNVLARNACGRGGAGFVNDSTNENFLTIARNLIVANAGTEPDASHGGALYMFVNQLSMADNVFIGNSVTQWGGALYIGAYNDGGQQTTATLERNVYRANRAGNSGGGLFCDDGATCVSTDEIYAGNCGGNILLDGGYGGSGPTTATFDHLTNVSALDTSCQGPGAGVRIDKDHDAPDAYSFSNSLFWNNAPDGDIVMACTSGCDAVSVHVTYSMIQEAESDGGGTVVFGEGILPPSDPLFLAPDEGNYILGETSPARARDRAGKNIGANLAEQSPDADRP